MTRQQLINKIKKKNSFLCVGLDPDLDKIPKHLLHTEDPIFEFNKTIIDATLSYAVAYKFNTAFYECLGSKGWESLKKSVDYLPKDIFKIADAKRGDIENSSKKYAQAFFEQMMFDAITVSPYMGRDSVMPFLDYNHKWTILLTATSNDGYFDFQDILIENIGEKLYEKVIRSSVKWGNKHNMMYVIGANRVNNLLSIRMLIPDHFLLIPGVGLQGGDVELICRHGMNKQGGLLINSSRTIIYAGNDENFGINAAAEAEKLQKKMAAVIHQNPL